MLYKTNPQQPERETADKMIFLQQLFYSRLIRGFSLMSCLEGIWTVAFQGSLLSHVYSKGVYRDVFNYVFDICSKLSFLSCLFRSKGYATWSSRSSVSSSRPLSRRNCSVFERILRTKKLDLRRSEPSKARWSRNVSAMANWVSL